tara:strand:- start:106 stop:333 length:228 start_codon:yes stop_codon:yes gene_type:complete
MPLPDLLSEDHSLHRISIQITKSQYALLKKYTRPGVSISSIIRRAIDDMFAPVIDKTLEEAKKMEEAPEIRLIKG